MASWDDLHRRIVDAIKRGDTEHADQLLSDAWRAATTDQLRCNTHFTEGMVRDAQAYYAEAEAAFQRALDLDRSIHGATHVTSADTLHSLGIVRKKAGNLTGAFTAFSEAAALYREGQHAQLAGCLRGMGNILLKQDQLEDARGIYREAATAKNSPWLDRAEAFIGAGEACRRLARPAEALGTTAMATRLVQYPPSPHEADLLSRAWFATGKLARYAVKNCQVMGAFAFWYATLLGDDEFNALAAAELATMPERSVATGDPTTWRFVYRDDAGNVHVSSFSHGLYYAKTQLDAELGDIVDVDLDNHEVVAIRRVS